MNDLDQNRLRQLMSYDSETGDFTWMVKGSQRSPAGSKAGTVNKNGYVVFRIDGVLRYAHRMAWLYVHGVMPEKGMDHINGIRSDNRISNLRRADQSENNQNFPDQRKNSSHPIGVCFIKRRMKWRARIHKNNKEITIGFFDSAEDARNAYLAAKRELHTFNPIPRGITA